MAIWVLCMQHKRRKWHVAHTGNLYNIWRFQSTSIEPFWWGSWDITWCRVDKMTVDVLVHFAHMSSATMILTVYDKGICLSWTGLQQMCHLSAEKWKKEYIYFSCFFETVQYMKVDFQCLQNVMLCYGHGVQSSLASRRMHIYVLSVVCYMEFESSK